MRSDFFRADLEKRPDHPSLVLFLLIRINRYKLTDINFNPGFPHLPQKMVLTTSTQETLGIVMKKG